MSATISRSQFLVKQPVLEPVEIASLESLTMVCWGKKCLNTGNPAAVKLYQSAQAVAEFFSSYFGLIGINGKGKVPTFNIDWDEKNAAWDCVEGSPCTWKFHNKFINRWIVCHEYTHAIIHEFTRLRGSRQWGALHESLADVMTIIFKRYSGNSTWNVLDRDMSQHFDMRDYQKAKKCTDENDDCFVHDNSRIPSHAFYAATVFSGQFSKIADVWYRAMLQMNASETFTDFARRTVSIASAFKVSNAVRRAWHDVGIVV